MNKTFKVARSLTRGTVVTSEKASSYQGKAVKTVVAAAVSALALSAGVVFADETAPTTVEGVTNITVGEGSTLVLGTGGDNTWQGKDTKVSAGGKDNVDLKDGNKLTWNGPVNVK